jgi:hypothetical protein
LLNAKPDAQGSPSGGGGKRSRICSYLYSS